MRYMNNTEEDSHGAIIELKTYAGGATASAFQGIVTGQITVPQVRYVLHLFLILIKTGIR